MHPIHRPDVTAISLLIILAFLLSGCFVFIPQEPTQVQSSATPHIEEVEVLVAETEFRVTVPQPLQNGQGITLEILDEVTGLALNPQRHVMAASEDDLYSLKLPIQVGSVVKYRYIREGNQKAYEYTSTGTQVRYRMVLVQAPGTVEDVISAWNDLPYSLPFGRITGRIIEQETNLPVVGSLVAAGGQQTLTASDGSFILDSMPPGKHNLVVYSLDGSTPPYQQEAVVDVDANTPVEIKIRPVDYVNVTFLVEAPDDIPDGAPIRLVGNTYPLGNTFADLRGGVSTIASRAPILDYQGNRHYSITVRLPTGLDLRYKFSLGDGFWNAERGQDGRFNTRQLIVPSNDITLEEKLSGFSTPGVGSITFDVTVSARMLQGETMSIQFNPYGWTEPIPMWPVGENHWLYILYSPLDPDVIREAGYRFCKNDQCGIADDAATIGTDAPGKIFQTQSEPQRIEYEIKQWAWRTESQSAIAVTSEEIPVRSAEFITGVEFLPDYHPSWQAYVGSAFEQIEQINSQWVVLSPTWHFTTVNPPVLSSVPGQDSSWYDLSRMAVLAREKGLKVVVHPTLSYFQPPEFWWMQAKRDTNWWQTWFDRYETFVINHADFSTQVGAEALILGDPSLHPAYPGGLLSDGTSSGVPDVAGERWAKLIEKVHQRFTGKIIWRVDYPSDYNRVPDFISSVDGIYVVLSGRLGEFENPQKEDIRPSAEKIIGNDILLLRDRFDKPVILGIAYPSATGASSGCISSNGSCLPGFIFEQAGLDLPAVQQNLGEQANIYNAVFEVVNHNEWIAGVIASGYYPAVALEDKSISIRGKPVTDVVWFWFNRFLGK